MLYAGITGCGELKIEHDTAKVSYDVGSVKRDMRACWWFLMTGMIVNGLIVVLYIFSLIASTKPPLGQLEFVVAFIAFTVLLVIFIFLTRFRKTLSASSWEAEFDSFNGTVSAKNESSKVLGSFDECSFVRVSIPGNPVGSVKIETELFAVIVDEETSVVPLFLSTSGEDYERTVQDLVQRVPGVGNVQMDCRRKIGAWGTVPSDWSEYQRRSGGVEGKKPTPSHHPR